MNKDSALPRAAILEIIENQIRDNNPREVRQTLERLLAEGQTKDEAMKLISCAMAVEIFEIMTHQKTFNESRYLENLSKLPDMPWEKDGT